MKYANAKLTPLDLADTALYVRLHLKQ